MPDPKFKRALEKVANEAVAKRSADIQRVFDGVHRSHAGKPIDGVKTALQAACRRSGLTPDAAQLRSWATAISDGRRIVLDVHKVRL
jgi:hypothetical protein